MTSSDEGRDGPGHGDRYYGPFGPPEDQSGYTPRGPGFDSSPPAWTTAPPPAEPPGGFPPPVAATALPGPSRRGPWAVSVVALRR